MEMLTTMGIFDAYGAGFEYVDPERVRELNTVERYVMHPKWRTTVGKYTDDTQMAVALAELLSRKPPHVWTHYEIARAFVAVFKRDPRKGYASRFYTCLKQMDTGWDFLKTIRPFSRKSGGAMRAPVLGLLPSEEAVMETARFQASLTHCTQLGMDAAAAAALMTHYFYHRLGHKGDLRKYLSTKGLCIDFTSPWRGKVDTLASEHVRAAVSAIEENSTMTEVLKACVDFTGDVDTVAAIAGPAVHFCETVENDLPDALITEFERGGSFGSRYLDGLSIKLQNRYPRRIGNESVADPTLILDLFT